MQEKEQTELVKECPECLAKFKKKYPKLKAYASILIDQSTTSINFRQLKCPKCGYAEPYKVLI